MEHQFSHDILGNPVAKCELECEPFGDWLSHDIGQDHKQIALLLEVIGQLQKHQLTSYQHNSKEYYLVLEQDEVQLMLNNNHIQTLTDKKEGEGIDDGEDNGEGQELSDLLIESGCGLTDFQSLLDAWRRFIR